MPGSLWVISTPLVALGGTEKMDQTARRRGQQSTILRSKEKVSDPLNKRLIFLIVMERIPLSWQIKPFSK